MAPFAWAIGVSVANLAIGRSTSQEKITLEDLAPAGVVLSLPEQRPAAGQHGTFRAGTRIALRLDGAAVLAAGKQ